MVGSQTPPRAFIWGAGGAALTPEEIARQREVEAALLAKEGIDTSPVGHWTEGLARVAHAAAGAYRRSKLDGAQTDSDSYNKSLIETLLGGSGAASTSAASGVPMSGAASEVAATSPEAGASGGDMQSYRDAIASIESEGSGDYAAIGPRHPKMGRALGRYQVMESNIGPWGMEALGREVTPDEFLANPEIQDAIFDNQFGKYVEKYGPEGAAQAWFGGEGGVGKLNRKDVLGTSIAGYTDKFRNALGGAEVASVDPATAMAEAGAGASLADEVAAFEQTPEYAAQFGEATTPAVSGGQQDVAQALANQQVAQATGEQVTSNEQLLRILTDPRANANTRAVAEALMRQQEAQRQRQAERDNWMFQQQFEAEQQANDPLRQIQIEKGRAELENLRNPRQEPTADQRNYEYYKAFEESAGRQPLGPLEWEQAQRKAGATVVNNNMGEGSKFYEALDKKNAEMFSALSEEGVRGRSKLAQIDRLSAILEQAPVGGGAALKMLAGEYGINTEGLSDLQGAQALINELVPQQRLPGSGPMSDADLALFKQSLPRIINQPEGNAMIIQTMRGITEYQMKMGEIADAVADRSITPEEGRKAIRALENPLEGYTKAVRQVENDDQDSKAAIPDDVDPADWEFLTPEERRLFQ